MNGSQKCFMTLPHNTWKHHDCIHEDRQSQNLEMEILCLQIPSFLVPRLHREREPKRAFGTRMAQYETDLGRKGIETRPSPVSSECKQSYCIKAKQNKTKLRDHKHSSPEPNYPTHQNTSYSIKLESKQLFWKTFVVQVQGIVFTTCRRKQISNTSSLSIQ